MCKEVGAAEPIFTQWIYPSIWPACRSRENTLHLRHSSCVSLPSHCLLPRGQPSSWLSKPHVSFSCSFASGTMHIFPCEESFSLNTTLQNSSRLKYAAKPHPFSLFSTRRLCQDLSLTHHRWTSWLLQSIALQTVVPWTPIDVFLLSTCVHVVGYILRSEIAGLQYPADTDRGLSSLTVSLHFQLEGALPAPPGLHLLTFSLTPLPFVWVELFWLLGSLQPGALLNLCLLDNFFFVYWPLDSLPYNCAPKFAELSSGCWPSQRKLNNGPQRCPSHNPRKLWGCYLNMVKVTLQKRIS